MFCLSSFFSLAAEVLVKVKLQFQHTAGCSYFHREKCFMFTDRIKLNCGKCDNRSANSFRVDYYHL